MRARHDDLRALGGAPHLDDVRLEAGVGRRALVGHLLRLREERLHPAEVEQRVAAVGLLDDAGDDVALATGVLLVLELALGLADPLGHHLAGRHGGDPAEVVRCDVELGAVGLAVLVDLLREHADVEAVGVDGHPGVLVGPGHALVRRLEGIGQRAEEGLDRDPLVLRQRRQGLAEVDVAHRPGSSRVLLGGAAPLEGGAGSLDVLVAQRALGPVGELHGDGRVVGRGDGALEPTFALDAGLGLDLDGGADGAGEVGGAPQRPLQTG